MFEVVHSEDGENSNKGFAAIDGIMFDYTPEMSHCETMPPTAEVKPTEPPTSNPDTNPSFCNFEDDLCGWEKDSGLNSTEQFVWTRTCGSEQDGMTGPTQDYDKTETSTVFY